MSKVKILVLAISFLLLSQVSMAAPKKEIYGLIEYVFLPKVNLFLSAKLDTGAHTSSISAEIIKTYKKNGKRWVEFYVATEEKKGYLFRQKILRYSRIKHRSKESSKDEKGYDRRPVVEINLCLAGIKKNVEVNLTDRRSFLYPLLLGASTLREFNAIVDPSLHYTHSKKQAKC